jgi:hypothetical protein
MLEDILEILPEPLFKSETLIIALNPATVMAFSDSFLAFNRTLLIKIKYNEMLFLFFI